MPSPFDDYRGGGRAKLGKPRSGNGTSRTGYGLSLQRLTNARLCAYCGVDLTASFQAWLTLTVDHVVPAGQAKQLGVPEDLYQDAINLVLACSGCNGYLNRYQCVGIPPDKWDESTFADFRDAIFTDRKARIAERREREVDLYSARPWLSREDKRPSSQESVSIPDVAETPDGIVSFHSNDAGYLAWLDAHSEGFVVNTTRQPSAGYLMLHRATCRTIARSFIADRQRTSEYIKACSCDVGALEAWAETKVGGALKPCGLCRPGTA